MATVPRSGHSRTDSSKLEDQAATAALYVTHPGQPTAHSGQYPLDEHQKLSAAGAATSLKHANPRDLPSFPVLGLSNKESSAGAAASLANAHQKPFEHWKPDPSASASAAAVLAKDYRPADLWHPELSAAGSKAALLAAQEGASVDIWRPSKSEYGSSAANLAVKASSGLIPHIDYGYSADGKKKSLMAATGAMNSSRKRAGSTPVSIARYPDSANAASNALNAATLASRSSVRRTEHPNELDHLPPSLDAARIHHVAQTNISRDMYTSHPPVAIEVEEKKRQDTLRAAAVSMAKQMYTLQQKTITDASGPGHSDSRDAANSVHGRKASNLSSAAGGQPPMQFNNLEEAARRLAAERLAKLHDEHAAYRDYYGQASPPQSRLSVRGRPRRRASSDGQVINDEEQSRRIRAEMSIFNTKVAEVDMKKRQQDREALMAAAQRNVRASMHGMDERVFAETGKVAPSMKEEWEAKARTAAEAESKSRMVNYGKVNIGGGRYLDQADVDAVAARNVQPVLDDINDRAEKQWARETELRLEQEEHKRQADIEKARQKETKAEQKRAKELEKQEERRRKEEEKSRKVEEKRVAKEAAHRAKEPSQPKADPNAAETTVTETTVVAISSANESPTAEGTSSGRAAAVPEMLPVVQPAEEVVMVQETSIVHSPAEAGESPAAAAAEPSSSVTSPKHDSKVKTWLKGKLPNRASKSHTKGAKSEDHGKSSVGGVAVSSPENRSGSSERRDSSIRDVAMAGKQDSVEATRDEDQAAVSDEGRPSRSPSPSISSVSSVSKDRGRSSIPRPESSREAESEEARDQFDQGLAPPPTFGSSNRVSDSPVRDSKFSENL
ncbi:MAG: hypothetical protein M1817_001863 [Caeruleum heppii]|nr:MAG: hypothetical protein M1817_001863 [Caeruleum heppii]